jgi:hypothetical protein
VARAPEVEAEWMGGRYFIKVVRGVRIVKELSSKRAISFSF